MPIVYNLKVTLGLLKVSLDILRLDLGILQQDILYKYIVISHV